MVRWRAAVGMAVAGIALSAIGCNRQATVSPVDTGVVPAKQEAELPFERIAQKSGISPTSSVIPPGANIPIGTAISVRLKYVLSSARQRAGDRFEALLDEPLVLNGETLVERGTIVTGRVLEARHASHSKSPGYLRLVLTSVPVLGKVELVQTSSAFLKGASVPRIDLSHAHLLSGSGAQLSTGAYSDASAATGIMSAADARLITEQTAKDVLVGTDHRLIFRLTEPISLPQSE
jgi:hypothetical protein